MTVKDIRRKGRPEKGETAGETIGVRLTAEVIADLDRVAGEESKKTGFDLSRANIIRQAVKEYLERKSHE